jgi:hypothetical protein
MHGTPSLIPELKQIFTIFTLVRQILVVANCHNYLFSV